jgi:hypothetical protein
MPVIVATVVMACRAAIGDVTVVVDTDASVADSMI